MKNFGRQQMHFSTFDYKYNKYNKYIEPSLSDITYSRLNLAFEVNSYQKFSKLL